MLKHLYLILIISGLFVSGCYRVALKDDVFAGKPLWESKNLQRVNAGIEKVQNDKECSIDSKDYKLKIANTPGLALLAKQVLNKEYDPPTALFLKDNETVKVANGLYIIKSKKDEVFKDMDTTQVHYAGVGQTNLIVRDDLPLDPEIAKLPVTNAIVNTLVAGYTNAVCGKGELPNDKLSRQDFQDFAEAVSKKTLDNHRGDTAVGSVEASVKAAEDSKTATKEPRDAQLRIGIMTEDKLVSLEGLIYKYLVAYYNGKFYDRNGGLYTKPKLGLTITNETITAFTAILIEAIGDYVIIDSHIKAPIVYGSDNKFVNGGKQTPTLEDVLYEVTGKHDKPYVVEPLQTVYDEKSKDPQGITIEKLDYIRYLSGISGDGAQSLSGIIVRMFGGANIGFGVMGKFSFGDNQTLVKIVDTVVESLAKRVSEMAVSHMLYDVYIPQGLPVPDYVHKVAAQDAAKRYASSSR